MTDEVYCLTKEQMIQELTRLKFVPDETTAHSQACAALLDYLNDPSITAAFKAIDVRLPHRSVQTRYVCWREPNDWAHISRDEADIDPCRELLYVHCDHLEWGYGGTGPTQAAAAILADFLRDESEARKLYRKLQPVLESLPKKGGEITGHQILEALCKPSA